MLKCQNDINATLTFHHGQRNVNEMSRQRNVTYILPFHLRLSANTDVYSHRSADLLSISHFPSSWKHSLVTPIPKPNKDPALLANWRPISNLNCVSKIFERILARRLLAVIDGLDIFETQYGFLRGISTNHALAKLQSAVCSLQSRPSCHSTSGPLSTRSGTLDWFTSWASLASRRRWSVSFTPSYPTDLSLSNSAIF